MNLYNQKIHHDPARITLKLDVLGTEAKPHFLCSIEVLDPGRPTPTCITLFLLSGLYSTECVQIVARLGRALILEAAKPHANTAQNVTFNTFSLWRIEWNFNQ